MNKTGTICFMPEHAHEPHIPCPKCGHQIPLTESIAAPLLDAERRNFQAKLAAKEAEFARKADELRLQQDEVARARASVEEQIKQRLETERRQVAVAEAKKARDAVASDLQARANEVVELQRALESNNVKLAEAQQAQAELMRKQRALDEEKRELDLTIEKRVQASVETIQTKARQEADEAARLRVAEKDQTIESMARTIEELKRKAEQGSQQSQGEVLEL
jgi:hypothetical protein